MIIMKYLNLFLLVLVSVFLTQSCKKLDDKRLNPVNSVDADIAITDYNTAAAAVNGLYNELQMSNGATMYDNYMAMALIYSDEGTFNGTHTHRQQIASGILLPTNTGVASLYSEFYDVINVANNVIERVPQVEGLGTDTLKDFLGQAKFVRALSYFYLTNYFGEIPLVLKPTTYEDIKSGAVVVPEATQAQVYNQVITDLKDAEVNIANTSTKKATQKAASALLARVYLYQGNHSEALTHAEKVITGYDLVNTPFLEDELFFLDFTIADGNSLAFHFRPASDGGRDDLNVSNKLANAFENGDSRYAASIDNDTWTAKYTDVASGTDPLMLMRYAEFYLIAAEAAAATNDFTKANTYFNAVRQRAGLADSTLNANNYEDAILHERFVELNFEGPHRFFDLRRTGKAATEITKFTYDPNCSGLWPIPQTELDRNSLLTQNPCY